MMRRTLLAAFVASAMLLAACGGEVVVDDPGRLVLWNEDSISSLEDGEFSDVDVTGAISQVTASADGTLVWTRIEGNPPSVKAVIDGEPRISIDTPTVPFFYEWSPTGDRIALLGNAPTGAGLLFGLIDVEAEDLTAIQSPPPFFFDWSPDGTSLIAHIGGSVLRIIDAETRDFEDLGEQSGAFPAPIWTDRGIVVATAVGATVDSPLVPVAYQTAASEIVLIDPVGESRSVLAEVGGPVRLFAADDAVALAVGVAGEQRIEVIGWDGQTRATLGQGSIDLLQWSPDGSTLLWTERDADGALVPMTWAGDGTTEYDAFRPSPTFATAYLPFWDQYDRTMWLWSPESTTFALPTRNGVAVHSLDGRSETYPGWDMAIWTPGPGDG